MNQRRFVEESNFARGVCGGGRWLFQPKMSEGIMEPSARMFNGPIWLERQGT